MNDHTPLPLFDEHWPEAIRRALVGYAPTPVAVGQSGSTVLRFETGNGETRYLKYGGGDIASDIANEVVRLHWLSPRISAASVIDFVQERGTSYLLTRGVPGVSAYRYLRSHPEAGVRTVHAIVSFMQALHALPVTDCPFDAGSTVRLAEARGRIEAGLVDTSDFDDARAGFSAEAVWAAMTELLPLPFERVVTHGDFSLDNILIGEDGAVSGIIDAGRVGVADPYQDIAILWNGLGEFGAELQPALWRALCISEPDERRLHFHLCLDEFF